MKKKFSSMGRVAIALVLALSLCLVTAVPAAAADEGTGACTVTPLQVVTGSIGNELTFTFATGENITGAITIEAPAGWSPPQGISGTAGYTTATSSGGIGDLGFSGQTVTVPVTNLGDMGGTITVVYGDGGGASGATAQSGDETAIFTTMSPVGGEGELMAIPDYLQPRVTVGVVALDAPYYEPGDTVTVTVNDMTANTHPGGIDSVEVTAKNNFEPPDEVAGIVLEESGVNTGIFTGIFGTSAAYPAPEGQLYVEDYEEFDEAGDVISGSIVNDTITVTYGGKTITARVNNDWPEVSMELPAEVTSNDLEYTDAEFSTTILGEGLGSEYTSVIFAVTIDASAALEAGDVVVGQTPEDYTIPFVEVGGNLVGYWGTPVSPMSMPDTPGLGFVAGTLFSSTTTFGLKIVDGPVGTYTVTVDLLDLGFPEEGGVAYHGGVERHVLASVSDTFEVVAAEPLMVSVDPKEVSVKESPHDITVTFLDEDFKGPDGSAVNKLDTVKVTLSGPGVDLASGDFDGTEGTKGEATTSTAESLTFSVTPEQAGTITVTVVGTFDDDPITPAATEELLVSVTGYLIEEEWADVGMETTGDIWLRVTTKAGVAVNTGIVTITAAEADGFEKDVDPLVAGDESFKVIVINGSTGEITYDATNAEDFLVSDGNYEVTGITFSNIGAVDILVQDAGAINDKAHFTIAFSVLGIDVYDLSFEPATLTAGVDLAALAITITEADVPVTDVHTITIGTTDYTPLTPVVNVYTVDPLLVSIEDTLDVMAKNEAGTEYGTAELAVELPTLTAVITETVDTTEVERNCMLVGAAYDYTIAVTALDAQGEPLALGKVWLGTYNLTTETFAALETPLADAMPLVLDADGLGDIVITQTSGNGNLLTAGTTLVWKVGGPAVVVGTAALLSTPSISVEALYYDLAWTPEAPEVGEAITFTVTNNYDDAAANRDVKVVSPGGDLTEKVTTPTGSFKYTATEAGDYYVSVKFDATWQDPDTVTVVITRLVSIAAAPESVPLYVGETEDLTITATYENETELDVTADATYVSDDESVATVDAGLITAVAEGTAIITVSYTEGVIDVETDVLVTVTPVPVPVSIAASPPSVSLNLVDTQTQQLAITATYSDASTADVTADATYVSDDESVATVSTGGLITAVALGDAIITVSYTEDAITKTADVLVTVTPVPVVEDVIWSCPLDHEALIAPYPANDRAFLVTAADLSEVTSGDADWFQVLWLDEETGEWKFFYSGFAENTLLTLEPGQYYYVIVDTPCDLTIPQ